MSIHFPKQTRLIEIAEFARHRQKTLRWRKDMPEIFIPEEWAEYILDAIDAAHWKDTDFTTGDMKYIAPMLRWIQDHYPELYRSYPDLEAPE